MTTAKQEFEVWLNTPKEKAQLEFKEARTQFDYEKVLKYCVALGNEGGGKLILGVSDPVPRNVVGTAAFLDLAEVQRKILEKLRFRVDIEEYRGHGQRVLIFHIPSRPRGTAFHLDGTYLMRSHDSLVGMTEDQLRAIFNEGKPDWLYELAMSDASPEEVVSLLDTQSYFDLLKQPYPTTREGVLERFEKENFITQINGHFSITNLGALLFAKKLEDFDSVKRKSPRVTVYEGNDKLKAKSDRFGGKGYAVGFEGLIDFINSQIPANEVIGAALRQEVKMFPAEAIRELVANALIHQDFTETGTSVTLELYADRLEIASPGKPFIDPQRFIDEVKSRNERLADIMRRLGICEEKGSGIDRVVKSAEVFQLPAPDIRVSDLRTTVVLFAHREFSKMNSSDRIRACYQHCALRYVTNDKMTNQSLRERFKLPEAKSETVSRIIGDTVDAGLVKQDAQGGSRKYARYVPFWA